MSKIDWRVLIAGMGFLTIAECVALFNGINGTVYSIYMLLIGAVLGVTIPSPLTNLKGGVKNG